MKRLNGIWVCLALLWVAMAAQARTMHFYYTDPQGTVLAKTDAQGNILARYDYKPYGGVVSGQGPNGPGYTGHENDTETGLVYMQARYYDPVGRFLSPDPIGPGVGSLFGFNRYDYANNNPIKNIDPTGMAPGDEDDFKHSAFPVESTMFGSWDGGGGDEGPQATNPSTSQELSTSKASQSNVGVTQILDDDAIAPDLPVMVKEDQGPMAILVAAAKAASDAVPLGVPQPARGTAVHAIFARIIILAERQGLIKGFRAEVSYIDHSRVNYGRLGSVRADVVFGSPARPQLAVDLKTGRARMTNGQVRRYYDNLPVGSRLYQISVP